MAVCFNAPVVETYRTPDASRHPGLGGLGPDLCRADADLGRCVELLLAYDDPQASVAEVLLDQRVFCGVGNVYRCEVLWAGRAEPVRPGRRPAGGRRRAPRQRRRQAAAGQPAPRRADHRARRARAASPCTAAAASAAGAAARRSRPAARGEHARILYWCPGCQVRFDPRRSRARRHARRWTAHPAAPPSSSTTCPGAAPADRRPDRSRSHLRQVRPTDGAHSVAIASRTFMFDALYDGYRAATKPATHGADQDDDDDQRARTPGGR